MTTLPAEPKSIVNTQTTPARNHAGEADEPRPASQPAAGETSTMQWSVVFVLAWFFLLLAVTAAVAGLGTARTEVLLTIWGVTAAAFPATLLLALGMARRTRETAQTAELTQAVRTLISESGLSESAKRVLHRQEERELLRRAIEHDIKAKDYDAALVLVNELADRFGYRGDAENYRSMIERAKSQTTEEQITEAVHGLYELIKAKDWNACYAGLARIERLFGDHHRVTHLRMRIDEARAAHRRVLERRFLEAAERQDFDDAMGVLKELDQYLTPAEAEPFAEVARGVISKSRENLGSRFKLLVQDHEWAAAAGVGQQIIEEFPNTRMAAEVRELLPKLREKAGGLTA